MSAWPRPPVAHAVAPAPSPPRSPAPASGAPRDLLRWDAAAVMFFPRRERSSSVDDAGEDERPAASVPRPAGRTIDRPAGAAVVDAGGPGCG
jgi:hypothetical protein